MRIEALHRIDARPGGIFMAKGSLASHIGAYHRWLNNCIQEGWTFYKRLESLWGGGIFALAENLFQLIISRVGE